MTQVHVYEAPSTRGITRDIKDRRKSLASTAQRIIEGVESQIFHPRGKCMINSCIIWASSDPVAGRRKKLGVLEQGVSKNWVGNLSTISPKSGSHLETVIRVESCARRFGSAHSGD